MIRCMKCGTVFEDDLLGEYDHCRYCGADKENLEDWANCICTACGWEGESNPNDVCPKCEGNLEEAY